MRTSSTRRINAHACSTIADTGTHREKRTEKMWMCSGRSGNARALLHRQSAWQKGYFVLATQSARVLPPQLLCVCVGCFGVDARTWQRRRAATAPRRLHKKKKKKTDVVASPGLSPKLPEKRWRGERASERIVGRPFRLLSPQSLGPSVSGGPGCPVQPLPPTWPLAVNSLAKRAPPPVQSRSTCRVCARASRAFTDPIVVFSHGDDDDRNRSTAAEFASARNRSAGLVRADQSRASSVAVQVRPGRRGGCGSPLAPCGVQTSATGGGGGGDIRFGHAVPRTLPLVRCLTARRKEPGRQAGWLALATWPSRVAGFRFRFRRTCLAERGGGGRCASLLPGGVSRHRTPVWVLEYARHHPASGAS